MTGLGQLADPLHAAQQVTGAMGLANVVKSNLGAFSATRRVLVSGGSWRAREGGRESGGLIGAP